MANRTRQSIEILPLERGDVVAVDAPRDAPRGHRPGPHRAGDQRRALGSTLPPPRHSRPWHRKALGPARRLALGRRDAAHVHCHVPRHAGACLSHRRTQRLTGLRAARRGGEGHEAVGRQPTAANHIFGRARLSHGEHYGQQGHRLPVLINTTFYLFLRISQRLFLLKENGTGTFYSTIEFLRRVQFVYVQIRYRT